MRSVIAGGGGGIDMQHAIDTFLGIDEQKEEGTWE